MDMYIYLVIICLAQFCGAKEAFVRLEAEARRLGLLVNEGKAKYMVTQQPAVPGESVKFGEYSFEKNSTQSANGLTELVEEPETNLMPSKCDKVKEHPPSYQWKRIVWPTHRLPKDGVIGGIDSPQLCSTVYVGRAWYKGNLLPAKICGSDGRAFVAYHNSEIMLNESEVLCSEHAIWKPIKEPRIPKNAFQGGITYEGEPLYVGRWFVGLRLTPGKIEASSKTLQLTYDQQVYHFTQYEVLILKDY